MSRQVYVALTAFSAWPRIPVGRDCGFAALGMTTSSNSESGLYRLQRGLSALWVVLLVLALYPYTADPAGPIKNLLASWAVAAMAFVWLYGVVFRGLPLHLKSPALFLVAAFLAANLLAALLSSHRANSLHALSSWAVPALAAVLAAQVYRRPEHIWRLMVVIVGAVSFSSLYGFCQWAGLDPFPWSGTDIEEYRGLPATYANPNFAGHALVLALPMACGLAFGKGWKARLFLVAAALMGGHLYLTYMRGGPLAILAAAVLLGVFLLVRHSVNGPSRAALTTCLLTAILGLLAAGTLAAGWAAFFKERPLPVDSSLILRANGYCGASQMILERPCFGFGPGNYALENVPYWTPFEKQWYAIEGKKNRHVHCDVLEAAVDAGVPGAFFYLALLAWGVLGGLALAAGGTSASHRRLGLVFAACFTAFAVDGLFGFNLRVPVSGALFFLLLGAVEGVMTTGTRTARYAHVFQVAIALAALALAALATCTFRAEQLYQQAEGARVFIQTQLEAGDSAAARTWATAYALLERGMRLMPWDPRFPERMGTAASMQDRKGEAVCDFEAALQRSPHDPSLWTRLAQVHINRALEPLPGRLAKQDDLDAAGRCAHQALSLSGELGDAHEVLARVGFLRAVALEDRGENAETFWRQAVSHLQDALRCGAGNRVAVERNLAQAYTALHEWEQAERAFRRAIEADPTDDRTWQRFRAFAKEQGQSVALADALGSSLARLQARKPVPTDTIATLSIYLAELYDEFGGGAAEAEPVLREALTLCPSRLDLWGALMVRQPSNNQLETLRKALNQVDPGDRPHLLTAIDAVAPSDAETYVRAGAATAKAAHKRNEEAGAEAVLHEFGWVADLLKFEAQRNPLPLQEEGTFLAHVGEVYVLAQRWEAADRVLSRATTHLPAPARGPALAHHSKALAALGHGAEALALAREAGNLAPSNPAVRWNLAQRLTEAGRLAEARFEYQALLTQVRQSSFMYRQIREEFDAFDPKTAAQPQESSTP